MVQTSLDAFVRRQPQASTRDTDRDGPEAGPQRQTQEAGTQIAQPCMHNDFHRQVLPEATSAEVQLQKFEWARGQQRARPLCAQGPGLRQHWLVVCKALTMSSGAARLDGLAAGVKGPDIAHVCAERAQRRPRLCPRSFWLTLTAICALQIAAHDTAGPVQQDDQAAITSIQLSSDGRTVAFSQACGVLNFYQVNDLLTDARRLRQRCA